MKFLELLSTQLIIENPIFIINTFVLLLASFQPEGLLR